MNNIEKINQTIDEIEFENLKKDVDTLKKSVQALKKEIESLKDALKWKADKTHAH
nr:hypothetical protein [uncultured Campylobacter sp.]